LYTNRIKHFSLLFFWLLVSSLIGQENLRICAIRVEFQTEENSLTTGDGRFLMDTSDVTEYTIDPPPHNRAYFRDQLIAVSNYYKAASHSRLQISGDVYPLAQNDSYQLPNPMGYYNPNTTEQENNFYLARLFVDAVMAADKDQDLKFADYDLITIFHAGVGNDIDLGFDETPQDIPSLYISPGFLTKALGDTFSGILTDDGQTLINKGIILPETESQAGLELAITGIFAANVGSFLGMYDLFSPASKLPGIGRFGLMDSGLFNLFGLSPALPCAFSRELMGWAQLHILNDPVDDQILYRLKSTESSGPGVVKIPLNSDEYYLLEYRGDFQVNIDSLFAVLSESRETLPTYLEVLKTYMPERITVSDSTGVLLGVEDYDWGLPGAGILIWHIDQQVIREKAPLNAINEDRDNRAVDLEEADGSQDIGYEYTIIEPGFNSELGTWLDFWFDGNPAPIYKNEFSVSTAPNSRSNRTRADSHIFLHEFSANLGESMSFSYQRDSWVDGFPLDISQEDSNTYSIPLTGQVLEGEKMAMITADDRGNIYGVSASGNGLFAVDSLIIARLPGREIPSLAMGDADQDGLYDRLAAVTSGNELYLFSLVDSDRDLLIDTLRHVHSPEHLTSGPVIQYPYFYIGTESGKILRFLLSNGQLDSTLQFTDAVTAFTVVSPSDLRLSPESHFAPSIIDLNNDGTLESVIFNIQDRLIISSTTLNSTTELEEPVVAAPSFADLDGDGYYELLFNSETKIYAYYFNASQVSNFPVIPVLYEGETLTGTPLVFDANGSGKQNILVATTRGRIFTYNLNGRIIEGFPVTAGGEVIGTPVATDLDQSGDLELYLLNKQGQFAAWQLETGSEPQDIWWYQANYSAEGNRYITRVPESGGGVTTGLMPAESVYNYPNPNQQDHTTIRYFLNEEAAVSIKIFDLAGDLVSSFNGPGTAHVHNEIRWNLTDVSSGVYLCRVEAVSASDKSVKIIKILVVN
jgi:M6 family metalloprotease-like protein